MTCAAWWPECDHPVPSESFERSFRIADTCSARTEDCNDPCVREGGKCVTAGLFVEDDGGGVFMVDTGSSIASLRPSFCAAHDISTEGVPITRNYVGWKNVQDTPTKYPVHVLGRSFHPTCADRNLAYLPSGGLVGVAPTPAGTRVAHASYMDNVPEGSRTLTFDKATGEMCVGCAVEGDEAFSSPSDQTTFVEVRRRGDRAHVLDTGTTETRLLGKNGSSPICLVGYTDIHSMAINYDTMRVTYALDEEAVARACWEEKEEEEEK